MDQAALRPCKSKLRTLRCPWGTPSVPAGEMLCKPSHTTSRERGLFHSLIGNVISDLTSGGHPWKLCVYVCWRGGGRVRQVSDTEDEGLILGDRKCIKSMNLAGVGLTLCPFMRENYRYQSSSFPRRTVLDGQNEGESGQENQNGPPGSQADQIRHQRWVSGTPSAFHHWLP